MSCAYCNLHRAIQMVTPKFVEVAWRPARHTASVAPAVLIASPPARARAQSSFPECARAPRRTASQAQWRRGRASRAAAAASALPPRVDPGDGACPNACRGNSSRTPRIRRRGRRAPQSRARASAGGACACGRRGACGARGGQAGSCARTARMRAARARAQRRGLGGQRACSRAARDRAASARSRARARASGL